MNLHKDKKTKAETVAGGDGGEDLTGDHVIVKRLDLKHTTFRIGLVNLVVNT